MPHWLKDLLNKEGVTDAKFPADIHDDIIIRYKIPAIKITLMHETLLF